MSPEEKAKELIAKGYRRTSIKFRSVSRIDRPDWVNVLAKQLLRARADFYIHGTDTVAPEWCDFYRRVLTKDKIESIDPEVFKLIPGSAHDPVGYVFNHQTEKVSKMAMSKDRIQFILPESLRFGKYRRQYEQLLDQVFGVPASEVAPDGDLKIICRPSQFGRFLVLRNLDGVANSFSCLEAQFVPDTTTEKKRVVDASQRRFTS